MDKSIHHHHSLWLLFRIRLKPIRENGRIIAQFLLAILIISVGAWFFKHEHHEFGQIKNVILSSKMQYILLGLAVTAGYIILQGLMYKMAFASVNKRAPISKTILLFLKRNLISIFMPAGGVTSLAFFTDDIESEGTSKTKIHFASSIYAFVGMLTVVLISIPILLYALTKGLSGATEMALLGGMILVIVFLYLSYNSLVRKKLVYRLILRIIPSAEVFLDDFLGHRINLRYLILTLLVSIVIDLTGIFHVYIVMLALGFEASFFIAMLGYLTSVISLSVSPFMRGLGAVEISMSFIFVKLGFSSVEALAITLLYRFFEFWLPLLSGVVTFLQKINKLLMRVFPAFLIFLLGVLNILSSVTPAITERVRALEDFIPFEAISASNYFVFFFGAMLLLTAIFLLRGHRNAWWIALLLSVFSCVGHLVKAIDWEEAIFALATVAILLYSRKEYYVRGNPRLHTVGIWSAVLSIIAALIYGTIGFYFLDKKHFGIQFDLLQSIGYTLRNFVLIGDPGLVPGSRFARDFLISINVSGFITLSFLFYTIVRPHFSKRLAQPEEFEKARHLVELYGKSSLEYFKTYNDKQLFIPDGHDAFISYRRAGNFAVVLENPVAANEEEMKQCIILFDKFCYENGYKSIFYRVPEENLQLYKSLSKKSLFMGQEGVVNLNSFSLEGGKNKALRNAINKVIDEGYKSTIHQPPIKDGLMQKLKEVSDEWLLSTNREEIIFSQGMFRWNELKKQTIITVENSEELVIAFANIIPDYAAGECTYDLIRKTADSPHGVMDFLLVELIRYMKSLNYSSINLGFAPMSGINDPHTFPERTMKFAYEKIKSFSHFKGSRYFKDKFFPVWNNRYLIYSHDYDLMQIPAALSKVIKPEYD